MLKTALPFILISILVCNPLFGQQTAHGSDHDHHHRHNEIALGTGPVFLPEESAWAYGLHLHAIIGIKEWLGTGLGYELILGEHTHQTITGLLHFHPFHPLDINIGPGLMLPDDENPNIRFKFHAEIAAVFEMGEHLHLGPSLDMGIGKHDFHIALGIHAGWVFEFRE